MAAEIIRREHVGRAQAAAGTSSGPAFFAGILGGRRQEKGRPVTEERLEAGSAWGRGCAIHPARRRPKAVRVGRPEPPLQMLWPRRHHSSGSSAPAVESRGVWPRSVGGLKLRSRGLLEGEPLGRGRTHGCRARGLSSWLRPLLPTSRVSVPCRALPRAGFPFPLGPLPPVLLRCKWFPIVADAGGSQSWILPQLWTKLLASENFRTRSSP